MRFLLILLVALSLTVAWQSSVLAKDVDKQTFIACEKGSDSAQGEQEASQEEEECD